MKEKIVIIGSGMAGCFMALILARKGYNVDLYEQGPDVRKKRTESGRSFNITLYYRGILALKKVGLWPQIKDISTLTTGNVAHYKEGANIYDAYDAHDTEVLYTVHRNRLNSALLDIVGQQKQIRTFFNTKCVGIDKTNKTILFQKMGSKKLITVRADRIIGADGVNSTVRGEMQKSIPSSYAQTYEDWGYKEVNISPIKSKNLGLKHNATHTWPRRNSLLIAFPNPDRSFTLMFNLPLEGMGGFSILNSEKTIREFIKTNFPDLMPIVSEIIRSFLKNPTGKFVTIKTSPWSYKDFMVLIGDSAHGVIPFYGQGVCAALDDCLLIVRLLTLHKNDWEKTFEEYERIRKPDTDTLAFLAKQNFIELRDKSRSLYYILKDKTDTVLNKTFPKLWLPSLYVLIAHGTLDYDHAYRLHKRQARIAWFTGLNFLVAAASFIWFMLIQLKRLLRSIK